MSDTIWCSVSRGNKLRAKRAGRTFVFRYPVHQLHNSLSIRLSLPRVQKAQRRLNGASLPRTQRARGTKDREYKTIVARVTNKIKHTTLHASVLKWKKVIKTKLLLQRRVRVMIHRWRSNQLRCGWKQWGSYTLQVVQELMETEKKTNTITKIFKKLQNKTLSIALLTWSQRITELRRMEVKKKRLLHRMLYRCVNKCFNAW